MTRFLLVEHGPGGGDDRVSAFLRAEGVPVQVVRPFAGEALPPLDEVVGAVIFGGPFAVFEEARFPFLRDEARLIDHCLASGVPLLGICQGAQQIARHLGAEVGPLPGEPHEFGCYEITPTDAGRGLLPAPLHVAQHHWHGFDLPRGAELLATGKLFPHQAFRIGPALAFQFHAEATPAIFRRWQASPDAPWDRPAVQNREEQDRLLAKHETAQHAWFVDVLAGHFGRAIAACRCHCDSAAPAGSSAVSQGSRGAHLQKVPHIADMGG